ncbi:DEAD/DEAH box helicase [Fusobacterium sp. IOR10]|uniref:DEAD/DEAH box helicase n=1 Tax=Fusobacterium sp. IOR10 TaxID=2665157 RepID=UPI002104669F|nr:helicase-related protein [Fusobacterium sp. IOR10]
MVEERANLVYKKYSYYKKKRSIAFCASIKHAEYMNKFFKEKGVKTVVLTGNNTNEKRKKEIQNLKDGKIDTIFVVDIFNEGIDIPAIDTILLGSLSTGVGGEK